jgi:NhaP-type Na+/H+ or K+/H+ antiporter
MPKIVYEIIELLASILRLIGMGVLGVGLGWLSLDLLRKTEVWQMQVAVFLGLVGLVVAVANFTAWGALGAFTIGLGVAIFAWGMPKKKKEEQGKK